VGVEAHALMQELHSGSVLSQTVSLRPALDARGIELAVRRPVTVSVYPRSRPVPRRVSRRYEMHYWILGGICFVLAVLIIVTA
jgi:hypothetical protein